MNVNRLVIELTEAAAADRGVVGGKAGTLGVLVAAGFAVPPGFVVPAGAAAPAPSLEAAVLAVADRVGPGPFAVRSSAAAEDLPEASYAGLYESYLDVDRSGLMEAVSRCAASAGAARVTAYHATQQSAADSRGRVDGGDGGVPRSGMAVLVQQMVDAAAAGVAFTANPVTGDREETVILAVRGLGEGLVSGQVTGEEWTVRGGRAQRSRAADETPALQKAQVIAVAELAGRVAAHFDGRPQDIEWAIDQQERLYLLQARPMTALPNPVDWTAPGPGLWTRNFRIGEWLPEAMTPLFDTWLLHRIETGYLDGMRGTVGAVVPFRYAAVNGWYYNATPIPTPRLLARVIFGSRGRAPWLLFNVLVRVARNPDAADRAVLADLERQWRERLLPAYHSLIDASDREVVDATPQRLVEIIDQVGRTAGEYLWFLAIVGGSAWKMEGCLSTFCRAHLTDGVTAIAEGPHVLLRGLPGAEPTLPPPHAVHSLDCYRPTAGETRTAATAAPGPPDEGRHARLAVLRVDAEQACRAALAARPRLLARFNRLLQVTQRYAVIREEQARDLTLGWPLLRRCVHRLGDRLHTAGVIAEPEDVFFLRHDDLITALAEGPTASQAETVTQRRAEWERQRRLIAPLTLGIAARLIGDPIARAVEAARSSAAVPDGAIIGQPASAGRATGPIHLITGPEDFAGFVDGEVLLAKATAPAWTPLFARAAAIVTDSGTLAAHASLLAREYGIPAVVGTGDATRRLRPGQLVTVDGAAGTVTPHDQPTFHR